MPCSTAPRREAPCFSREEYSPTSDEALRVYGRIVPPLNPGAQQLVLKEPVGLTAEPHAMSGSIVAQYLE